jgi:hypothetical protein
MKELKKSITEIINAGRKNKSTEDLPTHIQMLKESTTKVIQQLKEDFGF